MSYHLSQQCSTHLGYVQPSPYECILGSKGLPAFEFPAHEHFGQQRDKKLPAEHSKLFSDWCSELREIRTMSTNRLYFVNGFANLRLHIFTDASEEVMCIVEYLQEEAALKLTSQIGKCRVAPIKHMTIPKLELQAAVYGVRLRKQILSEHDVRIDKIYHWTDSSTVLRWLQAAHKKQQVFVANRAAEILENSSTDQWRHVKGVENPAVIGTRGIYFEGLKESVWLNGPVWLQWSEDNWPKPWCQENEFGPEQGTSTVATETKFDQLFDWRRYSTFNRIRNFIAYCMRFKTKQRGPLKADELHQAEQILFRFVQNESFPNVLKTIANSKGISKKLNIAKLSPFIEEDGTIRVKGRLKHSNLDYNAKHPILLTAKHPVVQLLLEKAHRDNLHEGTEYVRNMLQEEYWIIRLRNALRKIKSRCIKCRHRNAKPSHPPMADLLRTTWWTCVLIYPCRSWLLRTFWSLVPTTYLEKVVLPLYLPDNESSRHRSRTVIGHRVMSSCCDNIHCKAWLPKYHHQQILLEQPTSWKLSWTSGTKLRLKET